MRPPPGNAGTSWSPGSCGGSSELPCEARGGEFVAEWNSGLQTGDGGLFRFLGWLRGLGDAPRIILFLGVRDPFERGLVSLVIDYRLLLVGFLSLAAGTPGLGVRRHRKQRQYHSRDREGLHCWSPATHCQLTLQSNYGKPRSRLHETRFRVRFSAIVDSQSAANGSRRRAFLAGAV